MRYWTDQQSSGVDAIGLGPAAGVDFWSQFPKSVYNDLSPLGCSVASRM
jgi:hypothetical protein